MTIAYASNQVSGSLTTNSSGVVTVTLPSTTTAGNALVVVLAQGITIGVPAYTITDSYGNVYTNLYGQNINSNPILVFVATNIAAGASHHITFTYPIPFVVPLTAWVGEFSGLEPNSVVAEAFGANQDSSAVTLHAGGAATATHDGDLVLGIFNGGSFLADSGAWTQGAGYTLGVSLRNTGGGFGSFCLEWKVAGPAATEDATATTANAVSVPAMATVAITNLNIALVPLVFRPTAQVARMNRATDTVIVSASAMVAGVAFTPTAAGNDHLVVTASASGFWVGPRTASNGTGLPVVFHVSASRIVIGNKPDSGNAVPLVFRVSASANYIRFVSSFAPVSGQATFGGYVELEGTFSLPLLITDGGLSPIEADAPPTFRVFGPDGLLKGVVGSLQALDTGPIQNASNASPVVYTSANHNLTSGVYLEVSGILGNLGANAAGVVEVLDANTFQIGTAVGSGDYTGGGMWHVAGLYLLSLDVLSASGFEVASTYEIQGDSISGGLDLPATQTFIVT